MTRGGLVLGKGLDYKGWDPSWQKEWGALHPLSWTPQRKQRCL